MTDIISRDDLLRRVKELPADRTILIALDGWGGAGKTTLARFLAEELDATIVCSDDFSCPGVPQWEWPRFAEQVLASLLDGRTARYQRYDWDEDRLGEWHEIEPGVIVVAEGVSISRRELGDPWDVKVWVECSYEVRLARVAARDGVAADGSWVEHCVAEEEAYVEDQRPHERADFIILGYGTG